MGAKYVEPVWVRGKLKTGKKIIILPAFNPLSGATLVNKQSLLGPIPKQIQRDKTKIFLLDGTDLGYLSDLMER